MIDSKLIPLHLALVLSTVVIITARPNIRQPIRKYRYSVEEVTTSKTSQEPLLSSATFKTTTLLLSTTTTITEGNNYHDQQLYKHDSNPAPTNINHISYDDFIHLTCQEEKDPLTSSGNSCHHLREESSNTSSSSQSHSHHDNHTTSKLHRTFLRIPTTVSASKVILESEGFNEDHLFESYIYS